MLAKVAGLDPLECSEEEGASTAFAFALFREAYRGAPLAWLKREIANGLPRVENRCRDALPEIRTLMPIQVASVAADAEIVPMVEATHRVSVLAVELNVLHSALCGLSEVLAAARIAGTGAPIEHFAPLIRSVRNQVVRLQARWFGVAISASQLCAIIAERREPIHCFGSTHTSFHAAVLHQVNFVCTRLRWLDLDTIRIDIDHNDNELDALVVRSMWNGLGDVTSYLGKEEQIALQGPPAPAESSGRVGQRARGPSPSDIASTFEIVAKYESYPGVPAAVIYRGLRRAPQFLKSHEIKDAGRWRADDLEFLRYADSPRKEKLYSRESVLRFLAHRFHAADDDRLKRLGAFPAKPHPKFRVPPKP